MLPLAAAIQDIKRFIDEHEREVIVLDVTLDVNAEEGHQKPIKEEQLAATRVPGQLVHEAISCELKDKLASYKTLSQLGGNELAENPTIRGLTDIGVNVIYFWNTQQVLCMSFEECEQTP